MSEKTPVAKDEVDLIQVLKIIARFFEKVFNLIKIIASGLFGLLIGFLLLIKENIIKFLIIGIGTLLAGYLFDTSKDLVFYDTLNIQPNFGSTDQIYSDIRYYNSLILAQDTIELSENLGITPIEATSLLGIYIKPVRDENATLKMYDEFNGSIKDTLSTLDLNYEAFKENLIPSEFINHLIFVESTDPFIFQKIENSILNGSVKNNKFLKNSQKVTVDNYLFKDKELAKREAKIDSLRIIYSKVMLKSVEKQASSVTSIQFSENKTTSNDLDLFELENEINKERLLLNTDKVLTNDMINVVSGFQKRGNLVEVDFVEQTPIKFFIVGMLVLFSFLFIKKLNTYLIKYKKNINA